MQFLQHPLAIDATPVSRVMENMDFPEAKEELADNRIAHNATILALHIRNRN
jgi:hypothetical protein